MIGGEIVFFSRANKIIEQLELHSNLIVECFETYQQNFKEVADNSELQLKNGLENRVEKLSQLEKKADRVRHQVIRYLLNGGFLVDNRKSSMRLIEGLDKVADSSEDIFKMIAYEKIQLPDWLVKQIISINSLTFEQLKLYVKLMNKIVSDYDFDEVVSELEKIEELETKVDEIEIMALKQIFDMQNVDLAYKYQLKSLINMIASISDNIEDLSDEVEIILASRRI